MTIKKKHEWCHEHELVEVGGLYKIKPEHIKRYSKFFARTPVLVTKTEGCIRYGDDCRCKVFYFINNHTELVVAPHFLHIYEKIA